MGALLLVIFIDKPKVTKEKPWPKEVQIMLTL